MGCLVAVLGLITPRVVLAVLWLFSDYLNRAFDSGWWPLLGFFFLPTTTIGWAVARNAFTAPDGGFEAFGIVLVVLGVLIDLGLLGGGARGGIGRRRH
ncbi:MAG TPA: hypothetical protein VFZ96_03900 [Actinomycetota bacterium]|nr:hypothetical protein [Actinomycetota bacterium]